VTSSGTWAPSVLTIVLAVVLAVSVLGAGVAKLAGAPAMRQSADHLGFTWPAYRRIGALEIAGALGVLAGLAVPLLGVLAAACLALLLVLAVATHLRRGDGPAVAAPAAGLAVLAVVVVVLLVRDLLGG
jgi:uncharacterized membrane protein YphA (DoxX/SURF4 family)